MKLFMDTSNKKLVLAIINDENIIVDFLMNSSNNDMVKNTLPILEKFIKKNKVLFEEIDEYFVTNGPGSYTGVKVGINIIRAISLVNDIKRINVINTFDLITKKGTKYSALRVGKDKFYLRNNLLKTIKSTNELNNKINASLSLDYDEFDKEHLQEKINIKAFKMIKDINAIKTNYVNKF